MSIDGKWDDKGHFFSWLNISDPWNVREYFIKATLWCNYALGMSVFVMKPLEISIFNLEK